MIDLGALPGGNNSDALAVNQHGRVAGQSNGAANGGAAVVWATR
jgi:hypothetical protein